MQVQVPLTENRDRLPGGFQIRAHSRGPGDNQEGSGALEAIASPEPRR